MLQFKERTATFPFSFEFGFSVEEFGLSFCRFSD